MHFVKELQQLVGVLETYRGRDRFIRLATYGAMFMAGAGRTPGQVKWRIIASEMGACRVILRLFDDLPMLLSNLATGFGSKGSQGPLKLLQIFTSILNQGFYPVEHIGWLKEKQIWKGSPATYKLLGLVIWAVTLVAELLKSVLRLRKMSVDAKALIKQRRLDSGDSSQNALIKENLRKLNAEKKDLLLEMVQRSCDLTNAISWLPPGILWSQKLPTKANGILGMTATLIMLYRNWPSKSSSTS